MKETIEMMMTAAFFIFLFLLLFSQVAHQPGQHLSSCA
jgi:hypothetical protein